MALYHVYWAEDVPESEMSKETFTDKESALQFVVDSLSLSEDEYEWKESTGASGQWHLVCEDYFAFVKEWE